MDENEPKKPVNVKRKPVRCERLALRLTHKKDLEMWDELRLRSEYEGVGVSEILRQGLRSLAAAHQVADQLEGYEKRMGASLKAVHRHLNRIENAQQINMAFLEVLMRTYYFHTVPVAKNAQSQAVADANRRIARFIEDVAGLLEKGGTMQEMTMRLMDSDAGMGDGEE